MVWHAGWQNTSNWAAPGYGGDAARSQGTGKGKGKYQWPLTHANPLPLPPQTAAQRMHMGQSYLNSGQPHLTPEQLFLQIANGDWRGMATWLDAPPRVQIAFRQAIKEGLREFQFQHDGYGSAGTTFRINFDTMTSTNEDSGTVRGLRVSAAVMW